MKTRFEPIGMRVPLVSAPRNLPAPENRALTAQARGQLDLLQAILANLHELAWQACIHRGTQEWSNREIRATATDLYEQSLRTLDRARQHLNGLDGMYGDQAPPAKPPEKADVETGDCGIR